MIAVDLSLAGVGKRGVLSSVEHSAPGQCPRPETWSTATSLPRLSVENVFPGFYLGPLYGKKPDSTYCGYLYTALISLLDGDHLRHGTRSQPTEAMS